MTTIVWSSTIILTPTPNNMGLQELICAGRPGIDEKDESDYQPLVGSSMSDVAQSEKKVAVDNDDEDEMQGRLSDLRGAINDAKVDW